MSPSTHRARNVRRKLETALRARRDTFALTDLERTRDGYVLKFSRGIVILVRRCRISVLRDDAQLASLLTAVRRDFELVASPRPAQ